MVSIVLVTYNRADRLKLSIQDILNQSFKDFELIICDDCSPDSTEEVCRKFASEDKRIKYYRHSRNLKMPINCIFGIQKAIYPYVAILHDGDRFKPDLIAQWYKAISENESVGFVFNAVGVTDANDNVISHIFDYSIFSEGVIDKEHLLKKVFFRNWQFYSPVYGEVMIKKKLIEQHGFLKKKYGFYADVDLWMELLHKHDAYFCADTLITGPLNSIQPRLFDDDLIRYFLYMFSMQKHHRQKAYRHKAWELAKEMVILWTQSSLSLTFKLLVIIKDFSFKYFIKTLKLLKTNFLFSALWMVFLILYPLIYPFLRLYKFAKGFTPKPRLIPG